MCFHGQKGEREMGSVQPTPSAIKRRTAPVTLHDTGAFTHKRKCYSLARGPVTLIVYKLRPRLSSHKSCTWKANISCRHFTAVTQNMTGKKRVQILKAAPQFQRQSLYFLRAHNGCELTSKLLKMLVLVGRNVFTNS